jgi:hypothetical protein
MNPVSQNATSQLAAALKEAQRLDSFEEKDKKKVSPVPDIAKAIVVSMSADAKQRLLEDTLEYARSPPQGSAYEKGVIACPYASSRIWMNLPPPLSRPILLI